MAHAPHSPRATRRGTERAGKWAIDEDSTLKDAIEKHNGKNGQG